MHLPPSAPHSRRGIFSSPDPAATRKTKYGWTPRARGLNLDFTCVPFLPISLWVAFIFVPPSPEPSSVLGWLQLWGNIFTFLPSFSWPSYIRKIAAAQGKEAEGGKNSEFVTDRDSVLISTLLCRPQHNSLLSGQWKTVPREGRAKTHAGPLVLQKN